MRYWAERQDYSIEMVTSFTDGTKVQIEQCLVANGLGAGIAKEDLIGLATGDLKVAAAELGATADRLGHPISEYILDRGLQHGVFIIARHDERQATPLRNFKLGEGPYYVLIKDYCLVHLEVFKTIERVMQGRAAAAQQRRRAAGQRREHRQARARGRASVIERGCGSFDLRGTCVNIAERPGHVPICLASQLHVRRPVERGQLLTMDDVELPETEALAAWQAIERRVLGAPRRRPAPGAEPPDARRRARRARVERSPMDIQATAIPEVKVITPGALRRSSRLLQRGLQPARARRGRDRHRVRPGQPLLLGRARHAARAALPAPAGDPDQAVARAARRRGRRRGRLPGRLADLRPPRDGRALGRAPATRSSAPRASPTPR